VDTDLLPDYSKTVTDTYRDVAIEIMRHDGNLDILSVAVEDKSHDDNDNGLSSWATERRDRIWR
jgi:hypothetical protein